ncbi:hypothetical protein HCU64_01700 [Methylobacterium sp. C25]|uniref:hypothetical protein n=1 Tax=Methylobacterium sp. C25 TaxID=2721622 RepID=UPI001F3518FD|nr:hypothetical protein [Methylobacterium sp. C25]MCE4222453.1 hypothetical protein [Methylobacterium sp. C25]
MSSPAIFTDWNDTHLALWSHQPLRLQHRLHEMPIFSKDALADLIDRYPREQYGLVHMGAAGQRRFWREGEIGNMPGAGVIDAIEKGRMWLNLRNVDTVDTRYRAVLDAMFAELAERVPGFEPAEYTSGILISSPSAQVYYHCDLPGQHLWQIIGRKRVYVYPSSAPFVTPHNLEDIALFDVEVDMPYAPWYDEHAQALDLAPGQMLSWPLNAPHRVENLDCLNVSMTVSFNDESIRRLGKVNLANGILRHRFGYQPKSRAITGPSYWSKLLLQKAMRNTSWVKRERSIRRMVDFRLDAEAPGEIVELKVAA